MGADLVKAPAAGHDKPEPRRADSDREEQNADDHAQLPDDVANRRTQKLVDPIVIHHDFALLRKRWSETL